MSTSQTPYANLSPDLMLDAVESLGLLCNGSLSALNSYENRVYQIGIENAAPVIAKFYRPGRWTDAAIIEEHQFAQELLHLEIPVIAPLIINEQTLHDYAGFRFALFPRKGGRALEIDNMQQLERMGRFIARIHAVGNCLPFQHRIQLNEKTYGSQPFQFLLENDFIPIELKDNFCETIATALDLIKNQFQSISNISSLRLHGDCYAGNIILQEDSMHIVDLDDCLMGPAVQDIWMMLSGNEQDVKLQLNHILDGYFEFHEFDLRELRLVESLRTLRMIHYSGWLAKRWHDPAFPLNFPWFNTQHYWQNQLAGLQEQVQNLAVE